jgi:GNAT superfamily N-acetyltransferase
MAQIKESIVIRTLQPQDWATYRALRLRALADSPDAFYTTLAEEEERSPANWEARLTAAAVSDRDYPLIAEVNGVAAGLLWAKADATDSSLVDLFQMWVAPERRGCGVAAALLREAIGWARRGNARLVRLDVTCGDTPAVRLYTREGFQNVGAPWALRPGCAVLSQSMQLQVEPAAP